ncbi:MAG: hypothetical protein KC656_03840 [Myxococcales bacterium]|nr:hypothetical protein [Myxococcales bacterium]
MGRRQRVVMRCDFELVIEGTWSPECTIEQVRGQAVTEARHKLERLRADLAGLGVRLPPDPIVVRVILDEPEVNRG